MSAPLSPAPMVSTIQVSESAKIAYTDTGAPESPDYLTVFLIHGMIFSSHVFNRLESSALAAGVRLVSISRRGYHTTSPYTPNELNTIREGSKASRAALFDEQCRELGVFVSKFIHEHKLPPVSADRKLGGVAILGWSLGVLSACGILGTLSSQSAEVQESFAAHMRNLILLDVASMTLGRPTLPKEWMPLFDASITEAERLPMFVSWMTSYFDHNGRVAQDPESLAYVTPSMKRAPTIYNMSSEEQTLIIDTEGGILDLTLLTGLEAHIDTTYQTACFHASVRNGMLPHVRVSHIFGGSSGAFAYAGRWVIEADNKANGGGLVDFHVVPEGNHLMHWDYPTEAMNAIIDSCSYSRSHTSE